MVLNPFRKLHPVKEVLPKNVDSFLVCGMFTSNYAHKAARLEDSLKKFGLPYALYQTPSIHSSISHHGKFDSDFNKPRFINAMLDKYKLPILYIDVDCVIERNPILIRQIIKKEKDFAVFNWLSRERNDAYKPVNPPNYEADRFYAYSHGCHSIDEGQLLCSGAVQLWRNTESAIRLLEKWDETIQAYPMAADDISLNFAFNNLSKAVKIRAFWLPKGYARYAFWIFDKPIINHPEMPNLGSQFQDIKPIGNERMVYEERYQARPKLFYIQPNTFLDTYKNEIVAVEADIPVRIKRNTLPTYIARE
jgi:hypothetical protein